MPPQGWDRRTIVLLTFALLFVIAANFAQAQVFDLERDHVQQANLQGFWRFQTGDDPDGKLGWADPAFDDSSWKLVRSDQHIGVQGYPGYSGMAWYRFRILPPANHPPLALFIPGIGYCASYQVFAGGQLIGQFGGLPPNERVYWANCSVSQTPVLGLTMPIPTRIVDGKASLVIAIRVWLWRDWAHLFSPVFEAPSIGDARLMDGLRQHRSNFLFWSFSSVNAQLLVFLLAGFAGLALFVLRAGEVEYLWFAAFELLSAESVAQNVYPSFRPVWFHGFIALQGLSLFLSAICLSMFFVTLLKVERGWLFWSMMGSGLFVSLMFVPLVMQWMDAVVWIPVIYLSAIPFIACQLLFLARAARRGNLDARLLLGPYSMQYGATLIGGLLWALQVFGYGGSLIAFLADKFGGLFQWPFPISVQDITNFLCQISILAILVLRFARTRRDEERLKGELEAARAVQQVLIPEEIPTIAGLALECIYRPAGQVSGDFFQILPTANNGALIVIGDVSGKGMPAAMAVSLLVGTVRTLAHYTQSPAEILTAMNQRMLARSKDGFTTCLVLRFDSDGTATVANAGHLAPYVGAQELPIESGLPLGLAAEAVYTESSFHFDTDQELTLLTDGVAEARAKTGELFGFERTASISILSAEHIAATAKAFGQQDDITVLKIHRCPVPERAEVPLASVRSTSVDNALVEGLSASG